MKSMITKLVVVMVLFSLILGCAAPQALAQTPVRKLGRGIANILSGFLEIPINIVDAAESEGYIASVTYGVVKGVAMTCLRTAVGVYETATFFVPLPWAYETILEPEFLLSEDNF